MKNLLTLVENTINTHSMLAGNKTVCIAASGGPDSTALLHVLTILKPKLGITLTVCHFNHMIRPEAKELHGIAQ